MAIIVRRRGGRCYVLCLAIPAALVHRRRWRLTVREEIFRGLVYRLRERKTIWLELETRGMLISLQEIWCLKGRSWLSWLAHLNRVNL